MAAVVGGLRLVFAGVFAAAVGLAILLFRTSALLAYLLLALAEPFVGAVLSALAFGTFAVAVGFGFVLGAPFTHRWEVLAASVVCLLLYGAWLGLMRVCLRLWQP